MGGSGKGDDWCDGVVWEASEGRCLGGEGRKGGREGRLEALAPACNVVCHSGVAVAYMEQRRLV